MSRKALSTIGSVVAVLVVVGLTLWGHGGEDPATERGTAPASSTSPTGTAPAPTSPSGTGSPYQGLPWVDVADLPAEAQDTLALIEAGGPFPYPGKDGSTFGNFEGCCRGSRAATTPSTPCRLRGRAIAAHGGSSQVTAVSTTGPPTTTHTSRESGDDDGSKGQHPMSGLAGILAGHHAPGVYRWHAAFGPTDVRHAVEHAGWRFARVDGVGVEDRTALMTALGAALGAPDHFGRNLDAVWDVLRDADEPLLLLWDEWGPLARADRDTFDRVTGLLNDRAEQGGLAVLLRGEGPDISVPSLD